MSIISKLNCYFLYKVINKLYWHLVTHGDLETLAEFIMAPIRNNASLDQQGQMPSKMSTKWFTILINTAEIVFYNILQHRLISTGLILTTPPPIDQNSLSI